MTNIVVPGADPRAEAEARASPSEAEIVANYALTTNRQPDTRSDAEITAALKAYPITPEDRANDRFLQKAWTRRRKAKAAPRRRAVAARRRQRVGGAPPLVSKGTKAAPF